MKQTFRTLVITAAALLPIVSQAQQFPTVPDRTVIGRIGTGSGSGPSQAIPFTTLSQQVNGGAIYVTNSLQSAYNLCPATGGIVYVPAGYSETLTADLTMNTPYCGFVFLGTATITLGTHHINMGISVDGVFLRGAGSYQSSISGVSPVGVNIISAATTGAAIAVGASGQRTNYHAIANVVVDMRAASAGTFGIQLTRSVFWTLDHVSLAGGNGNNVGLEIDGTAADFGGFGQIIDPQIRNFQKGVVTTGAANAVQMLGGLVDCNSIASSAALTRDGTLTPTAGFLIYGTELSTCTTGATLTGTVSGDRYILYTENNTTDISAGASTTSNTAEFILAFTKSDSGAHNRFERTGVRQGTALSVLGNGTNATADDTDIVAAADGNVLRRSGTSVGFGSINLATGNAVSSQLLPANGGTGSNMSATGGANQVVMQTSSGGNFTAGQLAASNLSNGTTGSGGGIVLATGPTISAPTISGHPTIEGITSTGATGTGNFVFATSPTVTGLATDTLSVSKNQNATTQLTLSNTDNTNSSSRSQFSFTAGTVTGRWLAIATDGFYIGSTSANHFNLQYNGTDQVTMDGTSILGAVPYRATVKTFATLPTCNSGMKGAQSFISDSNSTTFHATAAGGGANNVAVTCDGTNWYVS